VVELGETLGEAAVREVREETGLEIEPLALVGYRQVISRDPKGLVERHFVILPFAARWLAGEIILNEELAEARWLKPSELSELATTEGLAEIVAAAWEKMSASS
jgi:ADP-ribose pyrophosphatase YjhB (NUDIX family)